MRRGCLLAAICAQVVTLAGGWFADARAQPAPLRVAVEDTLDAGPANVPGGSSPLPFPVAVRLSGSLVDRLAQLEERVSGYARRGVPVWLALDAPASVEGVDGWRAALQLLLARHARGIAILEIVVAGQDAPLADFVLRLASTDARASRESIQIALGGPVLSDASRRASLLTPELAPYFDLVTVPQEMDVRVVAAELQKVNSLARLAVTGADAGSSPAEAVERVLDSQLETFGTAVTLHAWKPSAALEPALRALAPLAPLMTAEMSALDASAASLSLTDARGDVTASIRHRLLFDNNTFATYLVYWAAPSAEPLGVSLTLPVEGVPAVLRLADGTKLGATGYSRNPETGLVKAAVPRPGGPVLVDFNEGATAIVAARSDVSAERLLSVDEIIARHQRQQRAQDSLVRSYMATARMEQHFRPTMTDPGYDVVTENRYYVADDGIEWEELSFSVNGSRWGADRPPFPLLQPEKVLSLPLQLRFGSDYRYRLAGTGRAGGFDCYIVRFEPAVDGPSLYRGTVWIDRRTFARVRVQAVQTELSAPVVSNEEIQTYAPVTAVGNQPIFLFAGLEARQILLIAGRNLLVEKRVAFGDFRVNDAGFAQARTEARRSDRIMYRETDRGLRYYVKEGERRVVSERATRTARAMAMGVTLDPSFAFPLPIFGINYLNFEFRGRPDTQLALLFGGVLAAGNLQRPKIGGTPLDASVDFFAIAVPSSDRLYDAGGEREGERLLTWPLSTGANLGCQYTPFQKVTGQYQFRFDGFVRDTTTADAFRVPASTVTHGFGGAWEYRRGGYSLVTNGVWFARTGWRTWGAPTEVAAEPSRTYVKYSATLARDFHLGPFQKVHVDAAWFGGRDLDRFGKYQFGMFDDTRIHGVPASGVRFGDLTMIRGAYSLNVFELYRLDLFLEQAWGRDRSFDDLWQPITGIGAAINFRAPWSTILRADVGKSFLPARYRGVGSATLQIMLLKPLR